VLLLLPQAAELASDLTSRRRSTLAAMLGRTRITPQQQDMLLGGSPASRICDLLLTLGSSEERLGLLPDCFTPPDDADVAYADVSSSSSSSSGADAAGEEETDELWCTPMQLLNEIEARLKAAAAAADGQDANNSSSSRTALGPSSSSSRLDSVAERQQQRQLPAGEPETQAGPDNAAAAAAAAESAGLTGQAALAALQELRVHIRSSWLESLPQAIGSSSSSSSDAS
jgi:hypothetical protein